MNHLRLRSLALMLPMLATSCAVHSLVTPLPQNSRIKASATALHEICQSGADGDWLVVRQYHATDNFVATVRNCPFSHAAVLLLREQAVIESTASGVHQTPLTEFIDRSHRILLIRPKWAETTTQPAVVAKAKSLCGKPYDFLGLVGLDVPDRYYCSELVMALYQPQQTKMDRIPHPVAPDQLYYYGKILYDTGSL